MPDNERARIRGIMYEPSSVWLCTENSGDRWLTDCYVLYNVTDAEFLREYDWHLDGCTWEDTVECSCPDELPDGAYQLMASGEWRAQTRDSIPEPDIEEWFRVTSSDDWAVAEPTEWSVAEHPGKAMLWVAGDDLPCLLGESTWTSIKRHHPDVVVTYHPTRNLFRFSEVRHDGCDEDADCGHRPEPFCFAAGIQVPEGQEDVAYEIARAA